MDRKNSAWRRDGVGGCSSVESVSVQDCDWALYSNNRRRALGGPSKTAICGRAYCIESVLVPVTIHKSTRTLVMIASMPTTEPHSSKLVRWTSPVGPTSHSSMRSGLAMTSDDVSIDVSPFTDSDWRTGVGG